MNATTKANLPFGGAPRKQNPISSNPDGFDVFLSHNSSDKPSVELLGRILKRRGIKVWLDKWELRPGLPWHSELERIVTICKSAVVCVGGSGIGPWEEAEMEALLSRFVEERRIGNIVPIIPVLLPGAPEKPRMPVFMGIRKWVDLRDADLQDGLSTEHLEELLWGITGERPPDTDFDEAPPKASPAPPRVKAAPMIKPPGLIEPDGEAARARAELAALRFSDTDPFKLSVRGDVTTNPKPAQIAEGLKSIKSTDDDPWISLDVDTSENDGWNGVFLEAENNGDSWHVEVRSGAFEKDFEVQEQVDLEQVILLCLAFRGGESSWRGALEGDLSHLTWKQPTNP